MKDGACVMVYQVVELSCFWTVVDTRADETAFDLSTGDRTRRVVNKPAGVVVVPEHQTCPPRKEEGLVS